MLQNYNFACLAIDCNDIKVIYSDLHVTDAIRKNGKF